MQVHTPQSPPYTPSHGRPRRNSWRWLWALVAVGLAVALLALGILPRIRKQEKLNSEADQVKNAVPVVVVIPVGYARDSTDLLLPGNVTAMRETPLYARVNGYIRNYYADIGAFVHRGQLLATIETPELDQQLAQARANLGLASTSLQRVESIKVPGAVSTQDVDQAKANSGAQQAMVAQMEATLSFKNITAPYDGVVTVRNVDVGTLINSGAGQELFRIDLIDRLRVFVDVPQSFVQFIQVGMGAQVVVQEFPNRAFKGEVTRTSNALDPSARTLRVEVQADNKDHQLLPGMYAQVRFNLLRPHPPISIPANTLLIGAQGTQVAVVTPAHTIHLQPINVSRDYGPTLELASGLQQGQLLVVNPTDKLQEGMAVQPQAPVQKDKPAAANPAAAH